MDPPWEAKTYRLIEEICEAEVVSDDCEPTAKAIAKRYFEDGGSGRAPRTIAATAVRLSRGGTDWASQEEIAEVADVSVTAMGKAYKELAEYADNRER